MKRSNASKRIYTKPKQHMKHENRNKPTMTKKAPKYRRVCNVFPEGYTLKESMFTAVPCDTIPNSMTYEGDARLYDIDNAEVVYAYNKTLKNNEKLNIFFHTPKGAVTPEVLAYRRNATTIKENSLPTGNGEYVKELRIAFIEAKRHWKKQGLTSPT